METTISSDCEIQNHINMDYDFSTLPPHVLMKILSHLDLFDFKNASATCKQWYYASCDPRFAETYMLYIEEPSQMSDLVEFVRPVTKLRFACVNFNKFNYNKLLQNLKHKITELHIVSCSRLRITQLFEIFIDFPNIKVLRLEHGTRYFKPNNFYNHKRITRHNGRIRQNLAKIQELYIETLEKDLKGAEILLNYCTNLKKLHWNEYYDNEVVDHFMHNVLINHKTNCMPECLESLTLHSINRQQNSKFFENLTKLNLINLRSLCLWEINKTYYDVMFKEFCKTYKLMESLRMSRCNNQQLADICKYMRDLKVLNLDTVTCINFKHIGYLNKLEKLKAIQQEGIPNESLIELFRLQPTNITELTLNSIISSDILKELCENLPQLQRLKLDSMKTKECEPIFRHLTKLVYIDLHFIEYSQINSKNIESDPEWNVTKLVELEYLYINTFLPGFTPDLIKKLPKLRTKNLYIYDVPERENTELRNNEENENDDIGRNENGNENEDDDENGNYDEENENNDNEEHEEDEEFLPMKSIQDGNREYDLTEFDVFSMWFTGTDTPETLINDTPKNLNTYNVSYLYIFNWFAIQLRQILKLKSWIVDVLKIFQAKAFGLLFNFKNRKQS